MSRRRCGLDEKRTPEVTFGGNPAKKAKEKDGVLQRRRKRLKRPAKKGRWWHRNDARCTNARVRHPVARRNARRAPFPAKPVTDVGRGASTTIRDLDGFRPP